MGLLTGSATRSGTDGSRSHQGPVARLPRGEDGYFLVMTLIVTAAVMVIAGGLASLGTASLRATRSTLDRSKALYAAESGLNEALYRLHTGGVTPSALQPPHYLTGTLSTGSYRVWLASTQPQCAGYSYTLVAEGVSGDRTRRLRVSTTRIAFPRALFETQCECTPQDVVPSLTFEPADVACARAGGCADWPRSNAIGGEGPVNILVDGDLELEGKVDIDVKGDVNVYVTGDLKLAPSIGGELRLNVSGPSRVNFYVYGDVVLGRRISSSLLGSLLNLVRSLLNLGSVLKVATNDWVVFNVQGGLTLWPGSRIRVSPAPRTDGPKGGVVFLFATDDEFSSRRVQLWPSEGLLELLLDSTPLWEMALWAPTREVDASSLHLDLRSLLQPLSSPAVSGAIVASQVKATCLLCLFGSDLGVTPNPRLQDFRFYYLMPGSWGEERPAP